MATSTLVATAGASNANTYCTLAVADQYQEDRVADADGVWAAATTANKNRALLFATQRLDDLIQWSGWVVNDTQALLWPRVGMAYRSGYYIPDTVIPTELQHATAEYARQLLADTSLTDDYDVEAKGIKRLKAGPVELEFSASVYAKQIPDIVIQMLPPGWIVSVRGRGSGSRELMRA